MELGGASLDSTAQFPKFKLGDGVTPLSCPKFQSCSAISLTILKADILHPILLLFSSKWIQNMEGRREKVMFNSHLRIPPFKGLEGVLSQPLPPQGPLHGQWRWHSPSAGEPVSEQRAPGKCSVPRPGSPVPSTPQTPCQLSPLHSWEHRSSWSSLPRGVPPPCIVRKDPRVPHTARRGA